MNQGRESGPLNKVSMTIQMKVECDANGCTEETEISDNYDSAVESEGWTVDPDDGYQHYCPGCWPKVKSFFDLMEAEKEDQENYQ